MLETIKSLFKKPDKLRDKKELLRENLGLIELDVFYIDDPIPIQENERKLYLKKFNDLMQIKEVSNRIKYLINAQAKKSLQNMDTESGAININGIATVLDDFKRLSDMYVKETAPVEKINRYNVI